MDMPLKVTIQGADADTLKRAKVEASRFFAARGTDPWRAASAEFRCESFYEFGVGEFTDADVPHANAWDEVGPHVAMTLGVDSCMVELDWAALEKTAA